MIVQKVIPCLWIEKDAKAASDYYLSIFKDGVLKWYKRYENQEGPSGDFDMATIHILGMDFQLLAAGPMFKFSEAVSFVISCKDQEEIDYYWDALIADGGSEGPCGWLKDKYGLSWQIVPERYFELEMAADKAKQDYANKAIMNMKKIIIADLEEK